MIPALLGKPTKPTLLSIVNSRRAEAPTSLQSLTQLTAFKEGLAMIYITG
jgi:hypothetical protein